MGCSRYACHYDSRYGSVESLWVSNGPVFFVKVHELVTLSILEKRMQMQIVVDWALISRCFAGLLWGILFACFIQFHRMGQFVARERTWISVIICVGVDLLLGIGGTWWEVWLIIALSSLGAIVRALISERREFEPALNRYRTKWLLEGAIDGCGDAITALEKALAADDEGKRLRWISSAMAAAHKAARSITAARYGEPEKSK